MFLANDMQETIAFYTDVLGFTLERTMDDPVSWCSLRLGDANLMPPARAKGPARIASAATIPNELRISYTVRRSASARIGKLRPQ